MEPKQSHVPSWIRISTALSCTILLAYALYIWVRFAYYLWIIFAVKARWPSNGSGVRPVLCWVRVKKNSQTGGWGTKGCIHMLTNVSFSTLTACDWSWWEGELGNGLGGVFRCNISMKWIRIYQGPRKTTDVLNLKMKLNRANVSRLTFGGRNFKLSPTPQGWNVPILRRPTV